MRCHFDDVAIVVDRLSSCLLALRAGYAGRDKTIIVSWSASGSQREEGVPI